MYRIPGSVAVQDVAADGRVLLSVRQGQPRIFGRAAGETRDRDLSWLDYSIARFLSSDGRTLLFDEQGLGGGPGYSAYIRGIDGSPPVRLGSGTGLALSPDGRWAAVMDLKAPDHAVLLPTGAGQPRALSKGRIAQLHSARFAEDGERLRLFANEAGRDGRIWEQSIEGGEDPRPISAEGVLGPVTPDGRWVLETLPEGHRFVSLDGKQAPRPVPGLASSDDFVHFTRDGRFLIARARGRQPVRLFRIGLASGRRELLREVGPGEGVGGRVSNIEISDDGAAYVYTTSIHCTRFTWRRA